MEALRGADLVTFHDLAKMSLLSLLKEIQPPHVFRRHVEDSCNPVEPHLTRKHALQSVAHISAAHLTICARHCLLPEILELTRHSGFAAKQRDRLNPDQDYEQPCSLLNQVVKQKASTIDTSYSALDADVLVGTPHHTVHREGKG